ncbi:MAG: precorrin-4 C(11)-methyltransferase [Anaerolineae bacterium]|nr:precorrin-4 C(11)-methyltransferase [Anaerolineae bacterium]
METYHFVPVPGLVYFVGAGPGAPDLIAVRGRDIIAQADLILYADSLVEESVAKLARKPNAKIVTSSDLHLDQMIELMQAAAARSEVIARVHSGDPSLYGAVHEQMVKLNDLGIGFEIVPGITAAFAAAARLKVELTVPDVVQTIILTRTAGRTTMPGKENLQALAATGASLAIYLSVTRMRQVVADLLASGGYTVDTPIAVLHKVTWPDESMVIGTLGSIVTQVREAKYTKHALILVSPALAPALNREYTRTSSHLYDASYTHRFRRAEKQDREKEQAEATASKNADLIAIGEKHLAKNRASQSANRSACVVIAITRRGSALALKLAAALGATASIPVRFAPQAPDTANPSIRLYTESALDEVRHYWGTHTQLILVMPTGIAVRAIAPMLGHKSTDPAVLCLDEQGASIIPLLGGHQAGANALAQQIAQFTHGQAIISTASDLQGKPALDLLGQTQGWKIAAESALTYASACVVNDDKVGVVIDMAHADGVAQAEAVIATIGKHDNLLRLPTLDELDLDDIDAGIIISDRILSDRHQHLLRKCVLYRPPSLVVGMGCQRDTAEQALSEALMQTLTAASIALDSVRAIATADLKADEVGLLALAKSLNLPLHIISSEQLRAINPTTHYSPSAAQAKFGLPGVAEPCAVLVGGGELILPKQSIGHCTISVASWKNE